MSEALKNAASRAAMLRNVAAWNREEARNPRQYDETPAANTVARSFRLRQQARDLIAQSEAVLNFEEA